ncbi:MAG TPA: RAD55 family ATPase [Thermoplasmata archaeon]|nr:RAD55 family ATPase [Thermoplasmata archaeon]
MNYSILASGPPGVGKFEWMIDLARAYLGKGERVLFVTLDMHPREVRERAASRGLDIGKHEGSAFLFVDCYSASASERVEEPAGKKVYTVSSYANLEGLGMAIAKAAVDLKPPVRIFFYTISTLFLHNSPQAIAKFFQIVTNRVKTNMGFIAYGVQDGVHDPMTMNTLRALVDGVVELRFNDAMGREVRAHHLRGIPYKSTWHPLGSEGTA